MAFLCQGKTFPIDWKKDIFISAFYGNVLQRTFCSNFGFPPLVSDDLVSAPTHAKDVT